MSPMPPYPHKIVLLRSRFQYPDGHLFFARARLYFDRIELSGWRLNVRHTEVIPLDAVRSVDWETGDGVMRAMLHLDDGREVTLGFRQGSRWRRALEMRLNWRNHRALPAPDRLPTSLPELIAYSTSMS